MAERGRWAALFADLEGALAGEQARDLDAEVRDRTRAEHARLSLADRLAAHEGAEVTVRTNGGGVVRGLLRDADRDWLVVGETLVPRTAILGVEGLTGRASEPDPRPRGRLGFGYALRVLAADGEPVTCTFVDGRVLTGPIERVGRDHLDVGGTTVPFRAVATVRPA